MTVEATDDAAEPFRDFYDKPVWVEWKENSQGNKIPYKLGSNFKIIAPPNDPSAWGILQDSDHLGIYLGNGLCGIDIDGCRDPATGIIDDWAKDWIVRFNSYTEVSPTGTGVKIFILSPGPSPLRNSCSMPGEPKRTPSDRLKSPGIEIYDSKRFFTVTLVGLAGTPGEIYRCDDVWKEIVEFVARVRVGIKRATRRAVIKEYAGRDDAMFKCLSGLHAAGYDDASVERMGREKNSSDSDLHPNFQAEGPLDERTFQQKLRQALKYEIGHPGPNGELAEMNSRYTVLSHEGGKFRIMKWVPSSIDSLCQEYILMGKKDFEDAVVFPRVAFEDKEGNPKETALGKWWLANPGRRQFDQMCFIPGGPPEIDTRLNIWRGFGFQPSPGDWSLLRNHLIEVLAAGNEEHAEYILKWMAWAVQNPGKPSKVALVFQGGQQTGKGTLGRTMRRLFGSHGVAISSSEHLTGRFNSLLHQCCLLFADEAFYAADRRGESKLKAFITEPTLTIERKGVDPVTIQNCLHIVMASNKDWIVPVDADDRRFAIFRISDHHAKDDKKYFDPLYDQLEDGGYEGLLHDLLEMPLDEWRPDAQVPNTEAKEEQKEYSDPAADWCDCADRAIETGLNRYGKSVTGWKMLGSDMRRLVCDDLKFWTGERQSSFGKTLKLRGYGKGKLQYGHGRNAPSRHCYYWGENPRVILEVGGDRKDGFFVTVSPWDKEFKPERY